MNTVHKIFSIAMVAINCTLGLIGIVKELRSGDVDPTQRNVS